MESSEGITSAFRMPEFKVADFLRGKRHWDTGIESEHKMAATTCLETKIGAGEEEASGAILLFISKPINKVYTKQDQYTAHKEIN